MASIGYSRFKDSGKAVYRSVAELKLGRNLKNNVREHLPALDAAVKIAQALDVSVEYLATGKDNSAAGIIMSEETVSLLQDFNMFLYYSKTQ